MALAMASGIIRSERRTAASALSTKNRITGERSVSTGAKFCFSSLQPWSFR